MLINHHTHPLLLTLLHHITCPTSVGEDCLIFFLLVVCITTIDVLLQVFLVSYSYFWLCKLLFYMFINANWQNNLHFCLLKRYVEVCLKSCMSLPYNAFFPFFGLTRSNKKVLLLLEICLLHWQVDMFHFLPNFPYNTLWNLMSGLCSL